MPSPFKPYTASFLRKEKICTSMCRVTFTGDFESAYYLGLDQRVKLIFPAPSSPSFIFPHDKDWYQAWKEANPDTRGTMRTYTIKAMTDNELVIDFAVHKPMTTPAMRWLETVESGEAITAIFPVKHNTEFVRPRLLGVEWDPPKEAEKIALYADITSLPAACNIVQNFIDNNDPRSLSIHLFLDKTEDAQEIQSMTQEQENISIKLLDVAIEELHDNPGTLLWEIGEQPNGTPKLYAWVAAERSIVKKVRTRLKSKGLDIKMSCMGYWRKGEASLD